MFRTLLAACAALLVLIGCSEWELPGAPQDESPEPGAALSPDAPATMDLGAGLETTGNHLVVLRRHGIPDDFDATVAEAGGQLETPLDPVGIAVVSGLEGDGLEALEGRPGVQAVVPDYVLPLVEPVVRPTEADVQEFASEASPASVDPTQAAFFPDQWHLAQIQAPEAWAAGAVGSEDVSVAILDTGIGYTHPDLAGLVDLGRSISLIPSDDELLEKEFGPEVHPVADLHWHGTHVAATVSSNALAAAGVTARTELIGVKICDVEGSCPFSAVLEGILHAADVGADVANLSIGAFSRHRDSPGFIATVERVINHATAEGTLVVAAVGNGALDLDATEDFHHQYCENARTGCVSSTAPGDFLSDFSNFGSAVDVGAPGSGVVAACSPFSTVVPFCQTGTFVLTAMGTSMASPHAAGVSALIAAERGLTEPSRVLQRMRQTADAVRDRPGEGSTAELGRGRVNAAAATGVH